MEVSILVRSPSYRMYVLRGFTVFGLLALPETAMCLQTEGGTNKILRLHCSMLLHLAGVPNMKSTLPLINLFSWQSQM